MRNEEFRCKCRRFALAFVRLYIARSAATIEEYSVTQWRSFFLNSSLLIPNS